MIFGLTVFSICIIQRSFCHRIVVKCLFVFLFIPLLYFASQIEKLHPFMGIDGRIWTRILNVLTFSQSVGFWQLSLSLLPLYTRSLFIPPVLVVGVVPLETSETTRALYWARQF